MSTENIHALLAETGQTEEILRNHMGDDVMADDVKRLRAAIAAEHERAEAAMRHSPTGYVHRTMFDQVKADRDALAQKLAEAEEDLAHCDFKSLNEALEFGFNVMRERDALARQVEAMGRVVELLLRAEPFVRSACKNGVECACALDEEIESTMTELRNKKEGAK